MPKIKKPISIQMNGMGYQNRSYTEAYTNRLTKYKSQLPGDLMAVILNDDAIIGTRKQFAKKIEAYVDAEAKDNTRNPKDFWRLEEIALLYSIPSKTKNQSWPGVHPDIKMKMKKAAANGYLFRVPGIDRNTDLEYEYLGPEHKSLENISQRSTEIAEVTQWFVGRALVKNQEARKNDETIAYRLPYELEQNTDFSLRAFLFGYISIYYQKSEESQIELEKPLGKTDSRKYVIKGRYRSNGGGLKNPDAFPERDSIKTKADVKNVLRDELDLILTSIFKLGMYEKEKDDIPSQAHQIEIGAGKFNPKLTGGPDIKDLNVAKNNRKNVSVDPESGTRLRELSDRLTIDIGLPSDKGLDSIENGPPSDDGLDFNLTYLF